jgi:hypothetical protein
MRQTTGEDMVYLDRYKLPNNWILPYVAAQSDPNISLTVSIVFLYKKP